MATDEQIRRERSETAALDAEIAALKSSPAKAHTPVVLQIFDAGAKPAGVPGQYAGHLGKFTDTPAEGAAVAFTPDTASKVIGTVWGGTVSVGDLAVFYNHGGRWHTRIGGAETSWLLCINVRACDLTRPASVAAHVTGPGGFNKTLTTNATGSVCVAGGAVGDYTVSIVDPEVGTVTKTRTYSGFGNLVFFINLGSGRVRMTLYYCCSGAGAGVNVEWYLDGALFKTTPTLVTSRTPYVCIPVSASDGLFHTLEYSIPSVAGRYKPVPKTVLRVGNFNYPPWQREYEKGIEPIDGYTCICCSNCFSPDPPGWQPTTSVLHATDPMTGNDVAMTYGYPAEGHYFPEWSGSTSVPWSCILPYYGPYCPNQEGMDVPVRYQLHTRGTYDNKIQCLLSISIPMGGPDVNGLYCPYYPGTPPPFWPWRAVAVGLVTWSNCPPGLFGVANFMGHHPANCYNPFGTFSVPISE